MQNDNMKFRFYKTVCLVCIIIDLEKKFDYASKQL